MVPNNQKNHEYFLSEADQKLWNPSYKFLLLPLESLEPFQIYWKEIAFAFITKNPLLTGRGTREEKPSFNGRETSMDTVMTDSDSTNIVHLADRSLHKDNRFTTSLSKTLPFHPNIYRPSLSHGYSSKFMSLMEIGKGEDKRTAFNSFEAHISLTIPSYGFELTGFGSHHNSVKRLELLGDSVLKFAVSCDLYHEYATTQRYWYLAHGDSVESIAGAAEPTPDKLELPPMRDLMDICDLLGYLVKDTCRTKVDTVILELHLQLKDDLLVGTGS
ncbi:Argonaute/Dicer protein, PAZ [Artemisia annua]|uniref:Argonaute/Dicer protein, PAZ n=1 Tax=Artemisia annua TaxID=35608 RepID=A0A2U1KZE3_ARTAN|nr:Argonaute/Dicer protein, PAZ [Artemisia annua]